MAADLREQCRRGARRTLADNGWELVQAEDAFVDEVFTEVQARLGRVGDRSLDRVIADATINRYGHVWHSACGAGGTLRQRRAFEELGRRAYTIAYALCHDEDMAKDCAQEALISVYKSLEQVRDPGAFVSYLRMIVLRVVNKQLHEGDQQAVDPESGKTVWVSREITEADWQSDEDDESEVGFVVIPTRPDGTPMHNDPTMTETIRARLETAIRNCLPKSQLQQQVIIAAFLDGKAHEVIAAELATTLPRLYVLKSKALKRLGQCQEFLDVLEELRG